LQYLNTYWRMNCGGPQDCLENSSFGETDWDRHLLSPQIYWWRIELLHKLAKPVEVSSLSVRTRPMVIVYRGGETGKHAGPFIIILYSIIP